MSRDRLALRAVHGTPAFSQKQDPFGQNFWHLLYIPTKRFFPLTIVSRHHQGTEVSFDLSEKRREKVSDRATHHLIEQLEDQSIKGDNQTREPSTPLAALPSIFGLSSECDQRYPQLQRLWPMQDQGSCAIGARAEGEGFCCHWRTDSPIQSPGAVGSGRGCHCLRNGTQGGNPLFSKTGHGYRKPSSVRSLH